MDTEVRICLGSQFNSMALEIALNIFPENIIIFLEISLEWKEITNCPRNGKEPSHHQPLLPMGTRVWYINVLKLNHAFNDDGRSLATPGGSQRIYASGGGALTAAAAKKNDLVVW